MKRKGELSGNISPEILMKRTRFCETQIIAILKQAHAGIKVNGPCRDHESVIQPPTIRKRVAENLTPQPLNASKSWKAP